MVIIFSFEVCIRLHQANKRVVDPDLDNRINPHEVKHWIDPRIIPYGWGLFSEAEEVLVLNSTTTGRNEEATLPLTSLVLRPNFLDMVTIVQEGAATPSARVEDKKCPV